MEEIDEILPEIPLKKAKRPWWKRIIRVFLFFVFFLVIIFSGVYAAFRSSAVQTKVSKWLATEISKKLKTKVEIQGVDIELFNKVVLEGLYVEDQKHDTLACIGRLSAGLKSLSFKKHHLRTSKVTLSNLKFYLKHYKGDEDLNLQFILDALASSDTTKDTTTSANWVLDFDGLAINNGAFKFNDFRKERYSPGMEFTFLDIKGIQLDFDSINIVGDTISAFVNHLAARDKCGFNLQHLGGKASISGRFLKVDNAKIKTPFSDIALDLKFQYRDWSDWLDFVDSVKIIADLQPSHLNFIDIGFFARPLFNLDIPIDVSGRIKGPVSNLKTKGLDLRYGKATHLNGNFDIAGLPDLDKTVFNLDFKEFSSNKFDIETIPVPSAKDGQLVKIPDIFQKFGQIKFKGDFVGYYYDFVTYGKFTTAIGELETDISMKNVSEPTQCSYSGKVYATDFNLGILSGNSEILGNLTANLNAKGKGLTAQSIDASVEGTIGELNFKNYSYNEIDLDGKFLHKTFTGRVVSHDENLKLVFNGEVDFNDSIPAFDFQADLQKANLDVLNLFKIDSAITVSSTIDVNFKGSNIDNALGLAKLRNTTYIQNKDTVFLKSVEGKIQKIDKIKVITLRSDVADADFKGNFTFADIPEAVNHLLLQYLPRFAGAFKTLEQPLDINADVKLKDTRLLEVMFAPKLQLTKGGSLKAAYNSTSGVVSIGANLPQLFLGKTEFKGIVLDGKNSGRALDVDLNLTRISFADSVYIENIELQSLTKNDTMDFDFGWSNNDGVRNSGDIRGEWGFSNGRKIDLNLKASEIYLADSLWKINPLCDVEIDSNSFAIKNLIFQSRTQKLSVNGKISENPRDNLTLIVENFELNNLNPLTKKAGIKLAGLLNGRADIANVYKELILTADVNILTAKINNELIGDGVIKSVFDNFNKALRLDATFSRSAEKLLGIAGFYYPEKKKNALNFDVILEDLPAKLAEPFTTNIFSNLGGTLSGNIHIGGMLEKIEPLGKVKLNKARLTIDYLNTTYFINDEVKITPEAFEFSNVRITDPKGNDGMLNGRIIHHHFSEIVFDLKIIANKLLALNTNGLMNSMYFGKANVTGLLNMNGNAKNIIFQATLKTEKGTQLNIPLGSSGDASDADFVKFISRKDTARKVIRAERLSKSSIEVSLDLEVTPDAEVKIIFDEKVGDVITARGNGNIQLAINTKGTFQMFGEYTIESGGYLFTLQNLVNKQFVIEKGGTIKWAGNPFDADLNLVANYTTKASVYDLLQETKYQTGNYRVDCRMNMTGRLLNPTINFDINLPNAPSEVQTNVKEAIPNEDKNKQVFGLLVLNKFFPSSTSSPSQPSNATNGTNGTNSLVNSTSELISSQLSNMLSQISKDFNLGVKYKPGDQLTSQELQVMVSTQLFSNRITVDGAFGYQQSNQSAANNQTNILGDVNVEYKITSDGRLRARAFNKTNDMNSISSNSAPYTQGMGLSIRREFDTLGGLFRSFLRKKQKLIETEKK